ncbi:MAG: HEAT repeat domain-containing protein [Pirellulales bacterium]|nr:HEAT repeat domain-containing protein [Pirellulales bacterium]MDA7975161.1 HEAT repeat domain-containing protein [Pirellulales bacterium]
MRIFCTAGILVGGLFILDRAIADSTSTHAQRMETLGYHRYRGSWRTQQEIDLDKQAEAVTKSRVVARQRLQRLRRELDKPEAGKNIAGEIRQTNDPFAVMALIAAINTDPVPRVRLLYVEALGNIVSTDAIGALLSLVLNHADSEVRWSAIEQLNDKDSMQVVPALVAALQGPDNQRINRAAVALKTLGDESAVQPLINVLITQSVVSSSAASGGKTSVTFSPTGGGLALGSNQKQKIISSQNTQVLEALTTLTGVNYGWDQTRWQLWFLNQGVSSTIDIRRDM